MGQQRASLRTGCSVMVAACVVGPGALAACGSQAATTATTAGVAATTSTVGPPTTSPTPVATSAPATTTVPPTTPGSSPTSTTPAPAGESLAVEVQSDAQMHAAGNEGPSSSILAPASCTLAGTTVTARGAYTDGGLAPEVYPRYGDVVELYVQDAEGTQIADLGTEHPPGIGGYGTWTAAATLIPGSGSPVRCIVAAQPTHDVQLAP